MALISVTQKVKLMKCYECYECCTLRYGEILSVLQAAELIKAIFKSCVIGHEGRFVLACYYHRFSFQKVSVMNMNMNMCGVEEYYSDYILHITQMSMISYSPVMRNSCRTSCVLKTI